MQQAISEEIIKLQAKGVLTIPKNLRKNFMEDNSLVRIKKKRGKIIIEPVQALPYPVRKYTDNDIEEFISLDNKETNEMRQTKRNKISASEYLLNLAKRAEKMSRKIKTKAPADLSSRIDHYLYGEN